MWQGVRSVTTPLSLNECQDDRKEAGTKELLHGFPIKKVTIDDVK